MLGRQRMKATEPRIFPSTSRAFTFEYNLVPSILGDILCHSIPPYNQKEFRRKEKKTFCLGKISDYLLVHNWSFVDIKAKTPEVLHIYSMSWELKFCISQLLSISLVIIFNNGHQESLMTGNYSITLLVSLFPCLLFL